MIRVMDRRISVRDAVSDEDFQAWRQVRLEVVPHERAPEITALRRSEQHFLLAYANEVVVGCGVTGRSDLPDAAFVAPRVLAAHRRQGVGSALLERLLTHAATLGVSVVSASVDDPGSLAFAARHGFAEVDRQIEQVRTIGAEPPPAIPAGTVLVTVAQGPELWDRAYHDLAQQAFEDMATSMPIRVTLDQWKQDWITVPSAMFLALAGDRVIGCAGLLPDTDHPGVAENALTAVARDWRGRGVAVALKQATLEWAAANGIHQVVTWTQRDNTAMRTLNERLGYTTRTVSISVRAPLTPAG